MLLARRQLVPSAVRGAAFPRGVWPGRRFFRADLGEWFVYDSTRGKWLGEAIVTWQFGNPASLAVSDFMHSPGGLKMSAANSYQKLPYDMTIVAYTIAGTAGLGASGTVQFRDNTTVLWSKAFATFSGTQHQAGDDEDTDLNATGDQHNAYVTRIAGSYQLHLTLMLRRRAA